VNEWFVKKNFDGRNPIGQRLTVDSRVPREIEVVGVCRNALYGQLREPAGPVVYVPFPQRPFPTAVEAVYQLRTAGNPLAYVQAVREIVHQADPRLPMADVATETEQIDRSMNQEITFARLCTAFGVLALLIACVGLYGTVAYNVARRTGEIGIRMALGAPRGSVVRMVLREVLLLAAVGLAISVPAALASFKFVASFLFGMKPNDPLALTAAVALLTAAAILAGYLPARRASRIDPMLALRQE